MIKDSVTSVSRPRQRRMSALCAVLLLLGLAQAAAAGQWSISGHVYYVSGDPAPSATVTLRTPTGHDYSTVSDSGGYYALSVNDPSGSGTALLWAQKASLSSPVASILEQDLTTNLTLSNGAP